jgi:citrate synthase
MYEGEGYVTARQAARRLGVKTETLYAYVSRGLLHRFVASDGRSSLFSPWEIDLLASKSRHRYGTVDVVVTTSTTEVLDEGGLRYRGYEVAELAGLYSFEEVAELLWDGVIAPGARWPRDREAEETVAQALRALPADIAYTERLLVGVMVVASSDPTRFDLPELSIPEVGRHLISALVAAFPSRQSPPMPEMDDIPLAARLWPRLSPLPNTSARQTALDMALVLFADHDLTPSTLAARIAASGRADIYSVIMCALGSFNGALHGRVHEHAYRFLIDAMDSSPQLAFRRARNTWGLIPGFGRRIHPGGDPRIRPLLNATQLISSTAQQTVVEEILEMARAADAGHPNLELPLAALALAGEMMPKATTGLFALSRMAGWIAHACEEYGEAPVRFRARAVYDGLKPRSANDRQPSPVSSDAH